MPMEWEGPPTDDTDTGTDTETGTAALSRRSLLQTSAVAGASALGATGLVSADHNDASAPTRDVSGDECLEWGGGELWDGDALIINNDWATGGNCNSADTEMCISEYGDGSYGWEWARHHTCLHGEDLPNFPQALMGTKIGGQSSGWGGLPEQTQNIDRLDVELDVEQERSDGEWNFMLEWWMDFDAGIGDPTDEILIVLEASEDHTKGGYVVENAIKDDYGNTIHYWENDIDGGDGADWNFHIFQIAANEIPSHVDCRSILDYLVEDPDGEVAAGGGTYDGDKYVSGIEIGNETWDNTDGNTVVSQFNVRVNDHYGFSGVSDDWTEYEETVPDAPENVWVDGTTESSVDLGWDHVGDTESYHVYVDGDHETETSTTSTTVSGLEPDTSYSIGVTAVADGEESSAATTTATTDEEETTSEDCPQGDGETLSNGNTVCDLNGDGNYRDVTASGDTTTQDLQYFFDNQHTEPYDSRTDLFDFTGNGDVGQPDVVDLFHSI